MALGSVPASPSCHLGRGDPGGYPGHRISPSYPAQRYSEIPSPVTGLRQEHSVSLSRGGISPALAARPATPAAIPRPEALRGTAPCQYGLPPAGDGACAAGGDLWDRAAATSRCGNLRGAGSDLGDRRLRNRPVIPACLFARLAPGPGLGCAVPPGPAPPAALHRPPARPPAPLAPCLLVRRSTKPPTNLQLTTLASGGAGGVFSTLLGARDLAINDI